MARLTRDGKSALTRSRLLETARTLFARDGYTATSLDRIAEEAGYSKGAVYSRFAGKDDLLLEVFEEHGRTTLADLLDTIRTASTLDQAIDQIGAWCDNNTRDNWPALMLEYLRQGNPPATFRKSQEKVLRAQWKALGDTLLGFGAQSSLSPEMIGALIYELAHAPGTNFVTKPIAGELVRAVLGKAMRSSK